MSPKLPLPIFLTKRYFPPTVNSLLLLLPDPVLAAIADIVDYKEQLYMMDLHLLLWSVTTNVYLLNIYSSVTLRLTSGY